MMRRSLLVALVVLLCACAITVVAQQPDLPYLEYQGRSQVRNHGDLAVFTGPGPSYYRSASGKAAISNLAAVDVWGRSGDYLLVQYYVQANGVPISRFAYAPVTRVMNGSSFDEVLFGKTPISIDYRAAVIDAPDLTRTGYNSINVSRRDAFALAYILDDVGNTWVYFESTGYSIVHDGERAVRGFVQEKYVKYE